MAEAAVTAAATCRSGPEAATAMWRDPRRWAAFVEGFQRVEEQSPDWPAEGAKVVWVSGPGGRGRVTEKVKADGPDRASRTLVYEERLVGTQTFRAAEDGGRQPRGA